MKYFIIALLSLISVCASASKRFLIESDMPIDRVSLVDAKTKSDKKIETWRENRTGFVFEASSLDALFLKLSQNARIRVYAMDDKISTRWKDIEKEKMVELKSLFADVDEINIELNHFLLKRFDTSPVVKTKDNLRNSGNLSFYTRDNQVWQSVENIQIYWQSGFVNSSLKIVDLRKNELIYETFDFPDTVLTVNNLPAPIREKFTNPGIYCIELNSVEKNMKSIRNSLIFRLCPIVFANQQNPAVFVTHRDIQFAWLGNDKQLKVSLFDETGNEIFSSKSDNGTFCTLKEIFPELKPMEKYKLVLEKDSNKVSKDFYILICEKEYVKLNKEGK
jgi:hypothetical protein